MMKSALNASWTHDRTAQPVRQSELRSVVAGSNPTHANLYIYISFCYIYYIILLQFIYISFCYTHLITSKRFQLKQTWRLTKPLAEIKPDIEQMMKLEQLYKVGPECRLRSWYDRSVGQRIRTKFCGRGFKSLTSRFSVATSRNPALVNTNMYQFILPHSSAYLKKNSFKINVVTYQSIKQNEIWHWRDDEIGLAVQSWLWERIELMTW